MEYHPVKRVVVDVSNRGRETNRCCATLSGRSGEGRYPIRKAALRTNSGGSVEDSAKPGSIATATTAGRSASTAGATTGGSTEGRTSELQRIDIACSLIAQPCSQADALSGSRAWSSQQSRSCPSVDECPPDISTTSAIAAQGASPISTSKQAVVTRPTTRFIKSIVGRNDTKRKRSR